MGESFLVKSSFYAEFSLFEAFMRPAWAFAAGSDLLLKRLAIGENAIMSVDGGSGSLEDLVKKVDDGLLLTTFWYIRMVDPNSLLLTGLTRDGVYHVKGGEVVGATNNFRWNDSPVSALNRIIHAGSTEWTQPREWAGDMNNMAVPPLVIKDFNMSTVSPGS